MTVSPVPLRIAGPGETVGYEKDPRPVLAGGFSLPARGGGRSGHSFLTGWRRGRARGGVHGVRKNPLGCGPVRCRWHRRFRPGVHESTDSARAKKHVGRRPLPLKTTSERGSRPRLKPSHPVGRLRCRWHRHPIPVRLRTADTPIAKIFSSRTERCHGYLRPAFYREPQHRPIMGIGFARFLRNRGRKGRANAHSGLPPKRAIHRSLSCTRGGRSENLPT
jgi:hypothetical protein